MHSCAVRDGTWDEIGNVVEGRVKEIWNFRNPASDEVTMVTDILHRLSDDLAYGRASRSMQAIYSFEYLANMNVRLGRRGMRWRV